MRNGIGPAPIMCRTPAASIQAAWLSPLSSCPCEAPLSRFELTGVAQLQLSIFWRQFNPIFQSGWLLAR
jgi:hypothetical protein